MNKINYNGKTYQHEKYNRIVNLGDGHALTDALEDVPTEQVIREINASMATPYSYLICGDKGLEPFEVPAAE